MRAHDIVDKALRPVPIGVPGELMIAGDGVVRGYLNRPELTAERFLSDPFDDDPEARLYRTGDLVRYLPDGNIEFIGRRDHQVKLRGHRIELGEIEDRLRNHPAVRDAVAIVREDNPSDMRIVAYWIAMNGESSQASELREHLRIKLPEYMLPAHFVRMDAFPQTPNKKIDRKAFPLPGRDPDDGLREFERPATAVEETLAELWRQNFGVDQVGRHDNFFDLGGHSLSSVQIVGCIGRAFNIKFPLRTFFEDPVLSSLALRVEDLLSKGADRTPRDAPSVAQKPRVTQGTARPYRSQQVAEKERIAVAIPESKELSLPPVSRRDSPERTIDEQVVQASPQTAWTPRREPFWRGLKNRILQVLALYSPGSRTLRVWLHRLRGVRLADNVEIGTGVIIETTYPQLVSISDNCEIGIRTVFIGHFREMADEARKEGRPTIEVEEEVFIGPGVTILPNVTIGRGAVVTAGSVVNELVAPHTVVQGNPAKPIAGCAVPLVNHTYAEFVANLVPIELEDRPHQLDNH